jgi:hypothetical protein
VKVGDLVRLLDDAEVRHNNQDIDPASVGLVTEVEEEWSEPRGPGRHGWRWVVWSGNPDWDCMYVEDLEVVNESR